jgi:hypothetical protein
MSVVTKTRKLDLPIGMLDDWDLLQAAFEGMLAEIGSQPGFDIEAILQKEFPHNQSKSNQVARLKVMLSQRNEWGYMREPLIEVTPVDILADALKRIMNESRLSQRKTVRQLLTPYLDTRIDPLQKAPLSPRCPWTKHFLRDFWSYLAEEKITGAQWLNSPIEIKNCLQPGPLRILQVLKAEAPDGFTVKELSPLTPKDALSDDGTPGGSVGNYVKVLERLGLIRANSERPKKWFFVKDYES